MIPIKLLQKSILFDFDIFRLDQSMKRRSLRRIRKIEFVRCLR